MPLIWRSGALSGIAWILTACVQVYDTAPIPGNLPKVSESDAAKECEAYARADKNLTLEHGFQHCMAKKGYRITWR